MTDPAKAPYDADPQPAPWRGHQRDGHLQRVAAEQWALAWEAQGVIDQVLSERAELERRLNDALARRDDAIAVADGLRFSDGECVSTLRTMRKEAGYEDFLDPNLDWLKGAPVPFKPEVARPRPVTWDRRKTQRAARG